MKLEGSYKFDAPLEVVWGSLMDPEVLAATLPGCNKLELVEGIYEGILNVKVGPVQGCFMGKVKLEDLKERASYTMVVDGRGAPGFMKATADVTLAEEGAKTTMRYDADAKVGGRLASVGQRLLEASAKAIIKQNLESLNEVMMARVAGSPEPVSAPTQAQFARRVASEVTRTLIPAPVLYGAVAAAAAGLAFLVIRFIV